MPLVIWLDFTIGVLVWSLTGPNPRRIFMGLFFTLLLVAIAPLGLFMLPNLVLAAALYVLDRKQYAASLPDVLLRRK